MTATMGLPCFFVSQDLDPAQMMEIVLYQNG
jgi:hypothetical protein